MESKFAASLLIEDRGTASNEASSGSDRVVESVDVVCTKSDCLVRRFSASNHLSVHSWPHDLPANKYDVGVVASFGHLIPTSSILACKFGMVNAHPSLLPRWRGAAPIVHTVLSGDSETGVTITQVSPNRFDVGSILLQERCRVPANCTTGELTAELSGLAARLVVKVLRDLPHYLNSAYPQATEGITYAPKVKPEQGLVQWERESSSFVWRKFRALSDMIDLHTYWKDMKVTLLKIALPAASKVSTAAENTKLFSLKTDMSISPGFCYFHKKKRIIFVKCQDGWCGFTSVKIPKSGAISAQDFYNGFMSKEHPDKCYFHSNNKSS